jgi:hypothetical protein
VPSASLPRPAPPLAHTRSPRTTRRAWSARVRRPASPSTPYPGDCHQGTSVITVSVHSRVILPLMPSALGGNRPSFALDASQTVPIGQFQEVDGAG